MVLEEGEDLPHKAPVRELVIAADTYHRDIVLRSYSLDHILVGVKRDERTGSFGSHRIE